MRTEEVFTRYHPYFQQPHAHRGNCGQLGIPVIHHGMCFFALIDVEIERIELFHWGEVTERVRDEGVARIVRGATLWFGLGCSLLLSSIHMPSCSFGIVVVLVTRPFLTFFFQPSQKTFRTKVKLAKAQRQNRPLPHWFRMKTDNTIKWNAKRRHWRRTKLGL